MNERIRELAIASQLVYDADGQLLTGWMDHIDLTEYLEKYAELIVKECCDKFIDMQHKFHPSICVYEIKQHFGVEG